MARPTIVSVSPTSGATGVPTNVSIYVLFDREVDTYRLKNGGIILSGPSQSKSIGPDNIGQDPPVTDEDKFLATPDLHGMYEDIEFTFERVNDDGDTVAYYDYGSGVDAGAVYRTKAIIHPVRPLASLTEYTVTVVGDEDLTDTYDFGLTSRTVYDPVKGANIGTGEVSFYGGYTGTSRRQFFIEITSPGDSGTALFEWWTSTDATHRSGRTSAGYRVLQDGLKVKFQSGLTYQIGDTFSVWCDVPEFMDGSSIYTFTTSNYEATTIPAASTLVTGSGSSTTTVTSVGALSVLSTLPEDRTPFIEETETSIVIEFSAALNSSTVTDSTVTINGHAADGSLTGDPVYTPIIAKSLSVSSSTLTITLTAGQLYENNIVVTNLDSSIADTDGNTLGADYEFFYGTPLNPFYAGIRHVRLRLGSMGNYYPDETIAMAIWDASREADAITPTSITNVARFNRARTQFVVCYAAWILVSGSGSSTGSVRKRLGDFDVSRSEGSGNSGLDNTLKDCLDSNQMLMEAGGDLTSMAGEPLVAVKGDLTYEPPFGRTWETPEDKIPISNAKVLYGGNRRWLRTFHKKVR